MAVSRALCRLLRVRTIEEEQCRLALEAASSNLRQLENSLAAARERARGGRQLFLAGAQTGELPDRLAGIEETRAAKRRALVLGPRIEAGEREVEGLRQAFYAKRIECRQAETLIRETEARDAVLAARRGQQALDDWYLNRLHSASHEANSRNSTRSGEVSNVSNDPSDLT